MRRTCGMAGIGLVCAWAVAAQAQENARPAEESAVEAQALVDAALRAAASATEARLDEDLDAWAQSVIERALSEAPVEGAAAPVPAEEHAERVAEAVSCARTDGPLSAGTEVIVFMSLSVPEASWRQWSREAARIGAPMVLRGVTAGGFARDRGRDPEQAA